MESKDSIRLHEIEMELDKTAPWENPPYRNARRKLNREKKRIWARLEGKDPMQFVCTTRSYRKLSKKQKEQYKLKRQVLRILDLLDKQTGPKWWERYK